MKAVASFFCEFSTTFTLPFRSVDTDSANDMLLVKAGGDEALGAGRRSRQAKEYSLQV